MRNLEVDLCVVGAGSAGLSAASIAAQLGARVVLIERGEMGGECLNTGCVPSKAMLAAAKTAHAIRVSAPFGIEAAEPRIDFAAVHRHVHEVIAAIAPHDSVERFERLGTQVIRAEAHFIEPRVLTTGDTRVRARRVIIATGSSASAPPIEGLDGIDYFTNESIFANETLPEHLLILGGGPIGMELAQAHRRLGAKVTVVENAKAMAHDDRELVDRLLKVLAGEGVVMLEKAKVDRVRRSGSHIVLSLNEDGQKSELKGSHLLVAAGRSARVASLHLERAGVAHTKDGIIVDRKMRTSARGVFAIGDVVAKAPRFTHIAGYHAGIAVQNALLLPFAKTDYKSLPWVTYTDPELAHVGATEKDARKAHGDDIQVVRAEMKSNDRAQTERATGGVVKVIARKNGQVLGVSILDTHAGELAHVWVLAIRSGMKLKAIAQMIAPYPTLGEANKAAAGEFYKPKLFGALSRRVVRLFSHLP